MLLCDDNLGKHENSGFKYIKYNPGKQESTGSKKKIYIYICNLSMKAVKVHPVTLPLSGSSPEGPKLQLNNSSS